VSDIANKAQTSADTSSAGETSAGEPREGEPSAGEPSAGESREAEPTDGELWRRAADGDGESFGLIYDRHREAIRAYCARRTGSLDVADDLVSIVFLEGWRRRREVQLVDDGALPWLYGVAKLTLHRSWRTRLRHRRALARLPAAVSAPDPADEIAARLDDERHLAQLRVAFAGLRPVDQEVLTLCVWQGLDYASAAVALGVPIGTVRSRLSRARARLHEATGAPDPPAIASKDPSSTDVSAKVPLVKDPARTNRRPIEPLPSRPLSGRPRQELS
jgi:RNA polymerase sigma factor (sigma-70 family)